MRLAPLFVLAALACSSGDSGPSIPAAGTYRFIWTWSGPGSVETDTVTVIVATASAAAITGTTSGRYVTAGAFGDGTWQTSAYRITMPFTFSPTAIVRTTFDGTCTGNMLYADFRSYAFSACTEAKQ